jgi:hypothetical protein
VLICRPPFVYEIDQSNEVRLEALKAVEELECEELTTFYTYEDFLTVFYYNQSRGVEYPLPYPPQVPKHKVSRLNTMLRTGCVGRVPLDAQVHC